VIRVLSQLPPACLFSSLTFLTFWSSLPGAACFLHVQ